MSAIEESIQRMPGEIDRMRTQPIVYCGRESLPAEPYQLRAGPLSMIFEPDGAFLRYLRLGEQEVLRGIYVAVRDRDWDTILPEVSKLRVMRSENDFKVTFEASCKERDVDFCWHGVITGDSQGTINFAMEGVARSTFLRNRIGFCVLHPGRECSAKSCRKENVDGTVEETSFPHYISPHQPFKNVQALSHQAEDGSWVRVSFEGDVFETEDQRNWTDESFKTYCTPLELDFPVEIQAGTKIAQSVTLQLAREELNSGVLGKTPEPQRDPTRVTFAVENNSFTLLPHIGLGTASHGSHLSRPELDRLHNLNPSHIRLDLDLEKSDYRDKLQRVAGEAEELGVLLEVALFVGEEPDGQLGSLVSELGFIQPQVSRWLVFGVNNKVTSECTSRLARRYILSYDPNARIGVGTNAYFTELNRDRPSTKDADLVCYSVTPQVHAFDNSSLVETLQGQAETVISARRLMDDYPIAVTPVTLKPRFNPNATGPRPQAAPVNSTERIDSRQMSLFGAGWTLGSLKYLSESGAHSITYYETAGQQGVVKTEGGPVSQGRHSSMTSSVFPVYHVLADAGEFSGGWVIPSISSSPLSVDGMVLYKQGQLRILLANLSARLSYIRIQCAQLGDYVRVKHLNETSVEKATHSPDTFRRAPGLLQEVMNGELEVCLLPYGIARIDSLETDGG